MQDGMQRRRQTKMSDIHKKLEEYLNEDESKDEYLPEEDVQLMDMMMEFIINLESDSLNEDQKIECADLIDMIADSKLDDELFEDDDLDEAVAAKKVKIKPSDKRARKRMYRKNRAALKLKAKKFRRTAKYKQYMRMKKRKASSGKTARGKRIRKFL
jgi:hypothetical protein